MTKFVLPNDMFQALRAGRIDVFALTAITVQEKLKQLGSDSGIEKASPMEDLYLEGKLQKYYSAAGFRKEDTDLLEAYNAAVKAFVGTPAHLKLARAVRVDKCGGAAQPAEDRQAALRRAQRLRKVRRGRLAASRQRMSGCRITSCVTP